MPLGLDLSVLVRRWRWPVLCALLSLWQLPVHADLWAYADDQGTMHFAASQVDARYQLYYKGNDVAHLDLTGGATAGLRGAGGQPLGLKQGRDQPTLALPRRFAKIDSSKGYLAVQKHLQAAARAHKVDYALLKAVVAAESGFNAEAVSPKGAVGLMQLMPATAERYGVVADPRRRGRKGQWLPARSVEDKLTDPRTNINAGTRYLAYLIQLFQGELELALAAYNAGEGAVQRAGNQIPNYRETQGYVKTVLGLYAAFKPTVMASRVTTTTPPAGWVGSRRAGRVRVELSGPAPRGPDATVDVPPEAPAAGGPAS